VTFLDEHDLGTPSMVMHRVVHGGVGLTRPCVISESVRAEIGRLKSLAPLHNGPALDWIDAARTAFSESTAQGACFDTTFYRDLPATAALYAVPSELAEKYLIRRYGFHGLAHQSLLERWRSASGRHGRGRVISMQLGGGCSITASDDGRPLETSMGFSPLEGLMMGTRAGNIDAAAVLYLIEEAGFSPSEVNRILNEFSGLRGVSGESADMHTLLESGSPAARLAVSMFCHRLRHFVGAYLAILGGADAILFGGGIGQHSPEIRAGALDALSWAGIRLDAARNEAVSPTDGGPIHRDDSHVEIWVTPTDEARMMARAAYELLQRPVRPTTSEDHP